jgi:hypothetical protein
MTAVYVVDCRYSRPRMAYMADERPPDGLERGLRLGCGAVFGLVAGIWIALQCNLFESWFISAAAIATSAILCAVCAVKYGDRFWVELLGWPWW